MNVEKEIMLAAINGIREYLRSTRGANTLGADADIQLVTNDTIQIVHHSGMMEIEMRSVRAR